MKSIQDTIDGLRTLSVGKTSEEVDTLKEMVNHSRMFAEIFGVYAAMDEKTREKEAEIALKNMSFEEKRKLYEAHFPNAVSARRRAKAREALNIIANNPRFYVTYSPAPPSNAKPITANLITSRSWPSSVESSNNGSESGSSEADLTAPRVGNRKTSTTTTTTKSLKTMSNNSDFNSNSAYFPGVFRFGSYDNFSKMTYDAAYSNTTQSQSPVTEYDQTCTPIIYDPELATPLYTCKEG